MAPRGLQCPPAGPTPPAQHCLPRSYQPHCPALPHTGAEKALGAIRALPAVTFAELRVFFVQAFWLRHSLVAVLFHLPASNTSFPHTHSLWTPPGASAFRVNTGGKCYETLMWQTTPLHLLLKANGMQPTATCAHWLQLEPKLVCPAI